jgi:hypothetical protein
MNNNNESLNNCNCNLFFIADGRPPGNKKANNNNKKQDDNFLIRLSLLVLAMGIVTPVTMIVLVPTVYFLNLGILPFKMIEGLFVTVDGWSDVSSTIIRTASFCFDLFFITTIELNGLPLLTHFLAFSILYVISRLDNIQRYF